MSRLVVLDTETTGLNARHGDRIIEIGCVEILDRRISERVFHAYLNPEREVELGATRVHGLTREDLMAKPKFAEVAKDFLDFVAGAEVIIHNADFDVEFLDLELGRARLGAFREQVAKVTDSLFMARELHPGRKNSLDALCERYFVNNANRTLHGALLDARLLAEVYLSMTRGQESLMMELETPAAAAAAHAALQIDISSLIVVPALPEEIALHERYLDGLDKEAKGGSLWRRLAA
ncbi:DNA polymerase III subunit epsilon [Betaproteobacteria bacterium SCGC AG-212-J23]|nr:DNA polymerase III subunit epsilon [Betaproteobacteria bacterium SCGC AG-212-J23]